VIHNPSATALDEQFPSEEVRNIAFSHIGTAIVDIGARIKTRRISGGDPNETDKVIAAVQEDVAQLQGIANALSDLLNESFTDALEVLDVFGTHQRSGAK
jgi:hypothetical protein